MKEIPVTFQSHGKQIVGMLNLPNRKKPPVVLACHGFMGNHIGVWYSYAELARELMKNGFAVLRFDFRGSGDSEGKFDNQTIGIKLEDFDNALKFLSTFKSLDMNNIGVIGHSQGGVIANFAAIKHTNIKCLVEWATVADFELFPWWTKKWFNQVIKRGFHIWIRKIPSKLYIDMLKYKPLEAVRKLNIPILFIHGTKDKEVGLKHSLLLYKEASAPKKLIKIKGADHLFSDHAHRKRVLKETIRWFRKWLK